MTKMNQAALALRQEILNRGLANEDQLDGELSISFMNQCHSRVNEYLSLVRASDVESCYAKPANVAASKVEGQRIRSKTFWINPAAADPSMTQQFYEDSETFVTQHPAFDSTLASNRQFIGAELMRQHLLPTYDNLCRVYQQGCLSGALELIIENHPLAPKEAPSTGVSGTQLQRWIRELPSLLEPYVPESEEGAEATRIAKLSSDEWALETQGPQPLPQFEINRRIQVASDFEKRHPEWDCNENSWQILKDWFDEFVQTPEGRGVQFGIPALELGYIQSYNKFIEGDFFWSEAPGKPISHGITTIRDYRKPHIPEIERSVEIREPDSAKRFSMSEILAWDSKTMLEMMRKYPELESQINNS